MRFMTINTGRATPSNNRVPGSGVVVGGGPTGTPPTDKPSIARPESNAVLQPIHHAKTNVVITRIRNNVVGVNPTGVPATRCKAAIG